jgi:hypothetical protein
MIVPQFWAEARHRERINGRWVTLRRFGWSDVGEAEAQAHAEQRVQEAVTQYRAGGSHRLRDRKVPYNGADGMPIREEIVARHGETIITRNSYGAKCLNTPDLMFVDVDLPDSSWVGCCLYLAFLVVLIPVVVMGMVGGNFVFGCFGLLALLLFSVFADAADRLHVRWRRRLAPRRFRASFRRFLEARPDWLVRLYETPNGFRLLAMHRRFDPTEPEVADVFRELGADPTYVRMCLNQRCFRARVSPKPWRVGIARHLRPRPGVWPVNPNHWPERLEWIARYEDASRGYSSCRFVEELGTGTVDAHVARVQQLHDELCLATLDQPIA